MSTSGRDTRIDFAGTPAFAATCLSAMVDAGHPPIAVYTQPDRPAGRGRRLAASEVKQRALALGLPVMQPDNLRDSAAHTELTALSPDLMVVVAYGLILPITVLEVPSRGCVNLHASLLPRWRGAAPIQRAILAGDTTTGVCLMAMSEGLDEGPVYASAETLIRPDDTSGSMHQRLAVMGAELLLTALPSLLDGSAVAKPQDASATSYAAKITKPESQLDWTRDAAALERQVRAFNPSPIAWTAGSDETPGPIRVWTATAVDAELEVDTVAPGTVVAEDASGIQVATGHGVLRIQRLQLPGKRPMDVSEFLNGRSLQGQRLHLAEGGAS